MKKNLKYFKKISQFFNIYDICYYLLMNESS